MPLSRPIVLVYQDLVTTSVEAGIPDLPSLYVGPAFWIQDYGTDDDDITIGDYIKATYTANAPCGADGSSLGRPDTGTTFLTLSEPPNFPSGGVLDEDSVSLVLKTAYIEVFKGTDGAITDPSAGLSNVLTTGTGGLSASKIAEGDRVFLTKDGTYDADHTVSKTVKSILSDTELELTSAFSVAEYAFGVLDGASGSIKFRVEHSLSDQEPDTDEHISVVGNAVTVKTGATGMWLTYQSTSFLVNYGDMYLGYRALRTDLQSVMELDSSNEITTRLGRIDERNPLAMAAQVGFANCSNPLKFYGVGADTLAGHQAVRDAISGRDDVYTVCPQFDDVGGANRISILSMWKDDMIAKAAYNVAKFRICVGGYDERPTSKSQVEASTSGSTLSKDTDPIDVFVDGASVVDFETANIVSTDLLDIARATTGALNTLAANETIFDASYGTPAASEALDVMGVIGKKRLRTTDALGALVAGEVLEYAVRQPILESEGGTLIADIENVTWANNAGDTQVAKVGSSAFAGVHVGDVVAVINSDSHDFGFIVKTLVSDDAVDLALDYGADANSGTIDLKIYRPVEYATAAVVSGNNTLTLATAFGSAAVGDIAFILDDIDGDTTNKGMWIVTSASANAISVATSGAAQLTDDSAGTRGVAQANVVLYRPRAAHGRATCTSRRRLVRLQDASASFITGGVTPTNDIEIPYPADVDPTHFDTTTTKWSIDSVVAEEIIDADLSALEELAPKLFTAGYSGDCPYRISLELDRAGQVTELLSLISGLKHKRCIVTWPNECVVTGVKNELTAVQGRHDGQYLAAGVAGMIAGLPSHQGLTYIGMSGISRLYNSNFYFSDDQIGDLSENGFYVMVQDSETSTPYSAHEVTTDTDTYESGELMAVKNLDFISIFYKRILQTFKGRYNLNTNTLKLMRGAVDAGTKKLLSRDFPRIGTPVNSGTITGLAPYASEADRAELYIAVDTPTVLNKIGLHIVS